MTARLTWVFENRAVAFLDILGFSALIKEAERQPSTLSTLISLRTVLDSHVRWDNADLAKSIPDHIKPLYLFISDSIILSSPLRFDNFDGLGIVVAKTIELSHKLLEMGFLLRGGISVGPVWHDERNIFGTGYIAAVNAEKAENHPRVVLTDAATSHWRSSAHASSPACRMNEAAMVVDTFFPKYLRGASEYPARIKQAFLGYRAWITTRLNQLSPGRARSKWEWTAADFNRALMQYGITHQPIKVPSSSP
jgi:hypothetical protein